LFALLPAVGPWTGSAFIPDPVQADIARSILLLKSASEFRLGTGISAIVTFPSFHVIVALVCGVSLWGFRRLRPITGIITAAICVSVITTGWHYATDVIGGIAVVLLSDFITRRWLLLPKFTRTSVAGPLHPPAPAQGATQPSSTHSTRLQ
jgi:membrane-associated phospholipid phosphatase